MRSGVRFPHWHLQKRRSVIDVVYVLVSVSFFGLMAGYVAGCNRLGRVADAEQEGSGRP